MAKPTLIAVYSPEGEKRLESPLNAIDLVRSCGFTYQPGRTFAPTDGLPFATAQAPSGNPAQEILDRSGHRSGVEENPAALFRQAEPEVVFDLGANAPKPAAAAPAPAVVKTVEAPKAAEPVVEAPKAPEPAAEAPKAAEPAAAEPTAEPAAEPSAEPAADAAATRAKRPSTKAKA